MKIPHMPTGIDKNASAVVSFTLIRCLQGNTVLTFKPSLSAEGTEEIIITATKSEVEHISHTHSVETADIAPKVTTNID